MMKILIIGGGRGGSALLDIFMDDPAVEIVGVCDIRRDAPAADKCREAGIPFSLDYHTFFANHELDLVIDVTRNEEFYHELKGKVPQRAELIGGKSARIIWELISSKRETELLQKRIERTEEVLSADANDFIVGTNISMREIASLIQKVAPTPTSVLIRGETGTGKEVIAREIFRRSHLKKKPFVVINCTALPAPLIESELFGHRKGAFTGANEDKIGLLEKAEGGTVFLDEIGDMQLELQGRLLRFLQSGELRRVGGAEAKNVHVRVIAATNQNLEEAIQGGNFRGDLFYRFNTFTITIPPLRNRIEDVELYAYHFLATAQAKVNKRVKSISSEAIDCLRAYSWPGNLRELENIIERAVVLTVDDEISPEALPAEVVSARGEEPPDFQQGLVAVRNSLVTEYEKEALLHYLEANDWNVSKGAEAARISRRTFHRLMAKHGISRPSM